MEIINDNATKMNLSGSFDSVVMLDVLEHIEDDVQLLRTVSGRLRTNGNIILKVPALHWLYGPMDKAIGHHRRYDRDQLESILVETGFVQNTIWFFNLAGIAGWWFNSNILKRSVPPAQQVGLFDKAVHLLRHLETWIHTPVGLSLIAVAGGIRMIEKKAGTI